MLEQKMPLGTVWVSRLVVLCMWFVLLFAPAAFAKVSDETFDAALAAVKQQKGVRSATWNNKSLPSLLVGVTGQGKQLGAYNAFAQSMCGVLAAKGIGGAFVHVLDEGQSVWVELGKAECPQLPTATTDGTVRVLDVATIAGKDEAAVANTLGKPVSVEKSKYGQKRAYKTKQAEVEIVFINGRADWITVYPAEKVLFGPNCGAAIGLPASSSPAVATPALIRWDGVNGWLETSAHSRDSYVWCWNVKIKTK